MEEKLREIVARIAETEPGFSLDASLRDDLHVDSVRAMGIEVPENRMGGVRTFADLASLVASVGAKS